MKQARILFFVDGPAPTADDFAEAAQIAGNVVFRNARAVSDDPQSLEICDGVAGCVPTLYAEKFPTAEEAVDKVAGELAELSKRTGDSPAPNAKATKAALARAEAATKRNPIAPTVDGAPKPGVWNPSVQK